MNKMWYLLLGVIAFSVLSVWLYVKTPFNKPPDGPEDSSNAWDKHFDKWKNKID